MGWSDGLRRLGRQPLWRRWTLASFLARLPGTMTVLALVLVGEHAGGSYSVGAWLAGVAIFTSGLAAPWRGRQLDRHEVRAGIQRACLVTSAVLAVLAVAVTLGAPLWALFLLAFVQGLAMAAITGAFRALLVPSVPADDLERANVLEAVFVEVAFIAGPSLAGVLAFLVGPVGVLVAMSASIGLSALVTRGLPSLYATAETVARAPWRTPGARAIYGLALGLGVCVGLFEAALPARMDQLGLDGAWAGPFLALMAAGSAVGGLVASARTDEGTDALRRASRLLAAFGVLLLPLALTPSLPALALALLLAGVPIAPMNALGAIVLQRTVPQGRQAEGFAVYVASILVGAGLGNGVTGQLLATIGPAAALGLSAAIPLAGAAGLTAFRASRLRRQAVRVT